MGAHEHQQPLCLRVHAVGDHCVVEDQEELLVSGDGKSLRHKVEVRIVLGCVRIVGLSVSCSLN